jgi:hypothetical protein
LLFWPLVSWCNFSIFVLFPFCSAASICATRQLRNPEFSLVEPSSLSSQQTARARVRILFLLSRRRRESKPRIYTMVFSLWHFIIVSLLLAYISFYPLPPSLPNDYCVCTLSGRLPSSLYSALYGRIYSTCVCLCGWLHSHKKDIVKDSHLVHVQTLWWPTVP